MIPNGDFEIFSAVPNGVGQFSKCISWGNANSAMGTPDYLHELGYLNSTLPNSVFGTVEPYSGNAVMGFVAFENLGTNFREYLSIELSTSMYVGATYEVSFYITNGLKNQYMGASTDHVGVALSTNGLTQSGLDPLGVFPQLEINGELWDTTWRYVSFLYKADSAYTHLTIGNFFYDSLLSVTSQVNALKFGAYYFLDNVSVVPSDKNNLIFPNIFTPNGDGVNDVFTPIVLKEVISMNTTIFNRWGVKVFETNEKKVKWDGGSVANGTYYWVTKYLDDNGEYKTSNGYISLLR